MMLTPLTSVTPALDEVEEALAEVQTGITRPEPLVQDLVAEFAEVEDRDLRVGDTVRILSVGIEGIVLDLGDNEVTVQAGAIRTRVSLTDVQLVHHVPALKSESAGVSVPLRAASPGVQIDLRGQTVDEALHRLERYVDEAAMASLPWVRIVHGKGTGKLRREVRRFVASHPLVTSYDIAPLNEGGEGATVVHLVTAR